mmetsp:Transcript_59684/g.129263  ORF Transcript_59684/g.129263 Transcript_59684/m.129263 type:complete len:543 (+) Transcript_59684:119-1747(+)
MAGPPGVSASAATQCAQQAPPQRSQPLLPSQGSREGPADVAGGGVAAHACGRRPEGHEGVASSARFGQEARACRLVDDTHSPLVFDDSALPRRRTQDDASPPPISPRTRYDAQLSPGRRLGSASSTFRSPLRNSSTCTTPPVQSRDRGERIGVVSAPGSPRRSPRSPSSGTPVFQRLIRDSKERHTRKTLDGQPGRAVSPPGPSSSAAAAARSALLASGAHERFRDSSNPTRRRQPEEGRAEASIACPLEEKMRREVREPPASTRHSFGRSPVVAQPAVPRQPHAVSQRRSQQEHAGSRRGPPNPGRTPVDSGPPTRLPSSAQVATASACAAESAALAVGASSAEARRRGPDSPSPGIGISKVDSTPARPQALGTSADETSGELDQAAVRRDLNAMRKQLGVLLAGVTLLTRHVPQMEEVAEQIAQQNFIYEPDKASGNVEAERGSHAASVPLGSLAEKDEPCTDDRVNAKVGLRSEGPADAGAGAAPPAVMGSEMSASQSQGSCPTGGSVRPADVARSGESIHPNLCVKVAQEEVSLDVPQ